MNDTGPRAPGSAVGIIGVGAMGLAMTEHLVKAGYVVHGYRRGSLDSFAAAGGVPMHGPVEVTERSDPLILLLPNDAAFVEVIDRIRLSLRPNQVVLSLATHLIEAKTAAAEVARGAGASLIDGEISGTPEMMRAGQASVMIAGDPHALDRAAPVCDAFAGSTVRLGSFGDATKMKLVTNYLVGVHTLAAAEALLLGRRLGLDPATVVQTITPSAGGSRMLAERGQMMADDKLDRGDMKGLMRYFEVLRALLAKRSEAPGPLLELTEGLYRRSIEEGHGASDIGAIYRTLDGILVAAGGRG